MTSRCGRTPIAGDCRPCGTFAGQRCDQAAQGEGALAAALAQSIGTPASERPRLASAQRAGLSAADLPEAVNACDRGAGGHVKVRCCRLPSAVCRLPCNPATITRLRKIGGMHACHRCWPPPPASIVNQCRSRKQIPLRFKATRSSSSQPRAGRRARPARIPGRGTARTGSPAVGPTVVRSPRASGLRRGRSSSRSARRR
jgi:hypothetical protein